MSVSTSRTDLSTNKSFSSKSSRPGPPSEKKNDDLSQKSIKSTSQKSGKSNCSTSEKGENINLIHSKGKMVVAVADFVRVSQVIKQRYEGGRNTAAVELKDYSQQSVSILATYIEKRQIKANVSFFVLAELLRLANCFVMEDFSKQLEEILLLAVGQSAENIIKAILVVSVAPVSQEAEKSLTYAAAWRFVEVARHPSFKDIPLTSFVNLIGSCELNVSSELNVADASLLWLSTQNHVDKAALAVFSMIRTGYLTKVDRQMVLERISTLRFPESVGRIARAALDSRHNNRDCLEKAHITRHLVRCGIPDTARLQHDAILPLSRPGQGVMYIKTKENDSLRSVRVSRLKKYKDDATSSKKTCKSEKSKKPMKKKQGFFGKLFGGGKPLPKKRKSASKNGGKSKNSKKSTRSGQEKRKCQESNESSSMKSMEKSNKSIKNMNKSK